jgi:circadian clock protein KaiB
MQFIHGQTRARVKVRRKRLSDHHLNDLAIRRYSGWIRLTKLPTEHSERPLNTTCSCRKLLIAHLLCNYQKASHNPVRTGNRVKHHPYPIRMTIFVMVHNFLRTAPTARYGYSHSHFRCLIRLGSLQKTFSFAAQKLLNIVTAHSDKSFMCLANFPDHHRIEIVDLLQNPQRGLADGIMVTPTLMKIAPEPKQMIMGNLSDVPRVLRTVSWNGMTK